MARTKVTSSKGAKSHKSFRSFKKPRPTKTLKHAEQGKQAPPTAGIRKPHRYRPGTVALREIRRYQKTTDLLTRRLPFHRMVKRLLLAIDAKDSDLSVLTKRFQASSIELLREAAEAYIIRTCEKSNLAAFHGKRITVMGKDVQFIGKIDSMSS